MSPSGISRRFFPAVAILSLAVAACLNRGFNARYKGSTRLHDMREGGSSRAFHVNDSIDVESYRIQFEVESLSVRKIAMAVDIELKARMELTEISLDASFETLTVRRVLVGGSEMPFRAETGAGDDRPESIDGDRLRISLPQKVLEGTSLPVRIEYDLAVVDAPNPDQMYGWVHAPSSLGFGELLLTRSWPYYARLWLPSNDHPSDVATYSVEATIPSSLVVLSGGVVASGRLMPGNEPLPMRTVRWEMRQPVATYNFSVVVGDLVREAVGEQTTFFFERSLQERASRLVDGVRDTVLDGHRAVGHMSTFLGPFPFDNNAFVLAPHPFNMEHASLITLPTTGAGAHEAIHQWWGNTLRIASWRDFWVSEGFTEYLTGYFHEVSRGENDSCHTRNVGGELIPRDEPDPMLNFTEVPYCRGALAVHGFRRLLARFSGGDMGAPMARALFEREMGVIYSRFKGRPVTSEEMVRFLVERLEAHAERIPERQRAIGDWRREFFADVFVP